MVNVERLWRKRDGETLLAERRAGLIRWLKADRDRHKGKK